MIDIRQSLQFADFMHDIGWKVEKIGSIFVYLRKFPFLGYYAKIPRAKLPFSFPKIINFKKSQHIFRLKIAPNIIDTDKEYQTYKEQFLNHGFRVEQSPFNPTTTIKIDLTQNEEEIFQNFVEAKRRGTRRAAKNGIIVQESSDIERFINIRKKQYFPIGSLVAHETRKLWQIFYPKNATLILTYPTDQNNKPLAGILLLFYDQIAYYWYASSLKLGKKLFAPTLLVWEALKLSKKRGCKIFDFEGICDERFPKASESWKGFTKFKEGFGGAKITYLENFHS